MNVDFAADSQRAALTNETLVGVTGVFAMMVYGAARYPASVRQAGSSSFLLSSGTLLAYAAAAAWTRRGSTDSLRVALANGARVGVLLGFAAVANMTLEHFVALGATLSMVRGVGMWGLMFVSFGAAASGTYQRSGSLGLAVTASLWCALISTTITLLFGFSLALLCMPHMQQILSAAFAQSGMSDPQAFVIRNTLNSASSHLLLAPFMAILFGLVGGIASSLLGSIRRTLAVTLGVFELLVLGAGLTSIRFASSLDRSERPPFILFGLLALGVTLACAHPVLTAIRRPKALNGAPGIGDA